MTQRRHVVPTAVPKEERVLLTPKVEALVGETTGVKEMYDVVDRETIRRHVRDIPDQDPRHWDEELARPRFGATTTPPMLVTHIAVRIPPHIEDDLNELMNEYWFRDTGDSDTASGGKRLTRIDSVTGTRRRIHTSDDVEMFRYPRVGDRIFYETTRTSIEEIRVRGGTVPALISRTETRYWNQDDETIMNLGSTDIDY